MVAVPVGCRFPDVPWRGAVANAAGQQPDAARILHCIPPRDQQHRLTATRRLE